MAKFWRGIRALVQNIPIPGVGVTVSQIKTGVGGLEQGQVTTAPAPVTAPIAVAAQAPAPAYKPMDPLFIILAVGALAWLIFRK